MTDILEAQKRKPDFMYEDLTVVQVDMVKNPATRDQFLTVRSADGTEENVPIIRSELTTVIDKPEKTQETNREQTLEGLGEEQMAEKLTEIVEKLSNSADVLNQAAERTASLFADVIDTKQKAEAETKEDSTEIKADEEASVEDIQADEATAVEADNTEVKAEEDTPVEEAKADEDNSVEADNTDVEVAPADETPVEAAPVEEAPAAAVEEAPADNAEMVAVRESLNKLNDSFGTMTETLTKLSDRLDSVERSVATPATAPVDDNQEAVERKAGSVFGGLIKV